MFGTFPLGADPRHPSTLLQKVNPAKPFFGRAG
jgi:hypothetical protein